MPDAATLEAPVAPPPSTPDAPVVSAQPEVPVQAAMPPVGEAAPAPSVGASVDSAIPSSEPSLAIPQRENPPNPLLTIPPVPAEDTTGIHPDFARGQFDATSQTFPTSSASFPAKVGYPGQREWNMGKPSPDSAPVPPAPQVESGITPDTTWQALHPNPGVAESLAAEMGEVRPTPTLSADMPSTVNPGVIRGGDIDRTTADITQLNTKFIGAMPLASETPTIPVLVQPDAAENSAIAEQGRQLEQTNYARQLLEKIRTLVTLLPLATMPQEQIPPLDPPAIVEPAAPDAGQALDVPEAQPEKSFTEYSWEAGHAPSVNGFIDAQIAFALTPESEWATKFKLTPDQIAQIKQDKPVYLNLADEQVNYEVAKALQPYKEEKNADGQQNVQYEVLHPQYEEMQFNGLKVITDLNGPDVYDPTDRMKFKQNAAGPTTVKFDPAPAFQQLVSQITHPTGTQSAA